MSSRRRSQCQSVPPTPLEAIVPRAPRHECRVHRCGLGLSLALGWIHFCKLISGPESSPAGWSGKPRCESLRASGADPPGRIASAASRSWTRLNTMRPLPQAVARFVYAFSCVASVTKCTIREHDRFMPGWAPAKSNDVLRHEHTRGGVRAQDNGTFSDLEEMSILGRAVAFARASAGRLARCI
jgi:hypothetical protein